VSTALTVRLDNEVDARTLHQTLGSRRDFSAWISDQIAKYDLVEDRDFRILPKNGEYSQAGQPRKDYALSLDAAKLIALGSKGDNVKSARLYLINLEKAWNTPELVIARGLEMANSLRVQAEAKVAELQPKAEQYDQLMETKGTSLYPFLKSQGYEQKLSVKYLIDRGILYRQKPLPSKSGKTRKGKLAAHAEYCRRGYFEMRPLPIKGLSEPIYRLKLLPAGMPFLRETLKQSGLVYAGLLDNVRGLLPGMEDAAPVYHKTLKAK
jgi:anti-repressor protein